MLKHQTLECAKSRLNPEVIGWLMVHFC